MTAVSASPVEVEKRSCFYYYNYLECSVYGVGAGISVSAYTTGGGSSAYWCTSYCHTHGPYTYAAITNGNLCSCSNTISPDAIANPVAASSQCYSVCQGSGNTAAHDPNLLVTEARKEVAG
ncbi:hypothetical protein FRB90_000105 [Tulasnella sp. 427]|nr:hypothetical protein FRB90_000105 [Tulasnella sp. 427]